MDTTIQSGCYAGLTLCQVYELDPDYLSRCVTVALIVDGLRPLLTDGLPKLSPTSSARQTAPASAAGDQVTTTTTHDLLGLDLNLNVGQYPNNLDMYSAVPPGQVSAVGYLPVPGNERSSAPPAQVGGYTPGWSNAA
jgi:hypothetical protein